MLRRMLAMMLCVAMLITMIPMQTFASESENTGTEMETAVPAVETTAPAREETEAETESSSEGTSAPVAPSVPEETMVTVETCGAETASQKANLAEVTTAGTCGDNAAWSLSDDYTVLTISGQGAMEDYEAYKEMPWNAYRTGIRTVVIGEGIESIGEYCFSEHTALTKVEIASTVTSIGGYAFADCGSLESISIPKSVATLSNGAFDGSSKLMSVYYAGTEADWNSIEMVEDGTGDFLPDGAVIYYASPVELVSDAKYTILAAEDSASPVIYGGSFRFTVTPAEGYYKGPEFSVLVNGTKLEDPNSDGIYTIENITEPQTVTAEGVIEITNYLVKVAYKAVTSDNLSGNYWRYDPDDNVLYLQAGFAGNLSSARDHLTVEVDGSVQAYGISATVGSLTLRGKTGCDADSVTSDYGQIFVYGSNLTVENLSVDITCENVPAIVVGAASGNGYDSAAGCFTVNNASVSAYSKGSSALEGIYVGTLQVQGRSYVYGRSGRAAVKGIYASQNGSSFSSECHVQAETSTGSAFGVKEITLPEYAYIYNAGVYGPSSNYALKATAGVFGTGSYSSDRSFAYVGVDHASYQQNTDGATHSLMCGCFSYSMGEKIACSGGEATCSKKAVCTVCGSGYGETNDEHSFDLSTGLCEICGLPAASCGENLIYILQNGILYIFGDGEMEDYTSGGAPWYDSREEITQVFLPEGITSIGAYAFEDCTGLTAMAISETVTTIGTNAFSGCDDLVVTYAGTANQWRLMGYKMEKTVCSDGVLWDFGSCGDNLVYMIVDDTLHIFIEEGMEGAGVMADYTSGGAPWFAYGTRINKISLAEGVAAIGSFAFENLINVSTIAIPASVATINRNAFSGCTGLKHIYIPETVTTIRASTYSYSPFYGCSENLEIYCSPAVRPRGWGSYWNHQAYGVVLTTTFGCDRENYDYWTTLDKTASSVDIPDGITLIPVKAFYNRTTLTNITIPDSVTVINNNAFTGCYGLRHVFIPSSVTSIIAASYSHAPFNGTSAKLYCEERTAPSGWGEYWQYGVNVVWGFTREEYRQWCELDLSGPELVLPQGITSIPYRAFQYRSDLASVMIPETVTTIGDGAFYACSGLMDMTLPEGVVSVGSEAFAYCDALLTVSIPPSVTELADSAFFNCNNLISYWVDSENTKYATDEFGVLFNKNMTTLLRAPAGLLGVYDIPDSVTEIGAGAFASCDGLEEITFSMGLTKIGERAFDRCIGLTKLRLPDGITEIGERAFSGCTLLEWVFIPASVTTIGGTEAGYGPFYACSQQLSIYMEAASESDEWGDYWDKTSWQQLSVFYGCTGAEMEYWEKLDKTASVIEIPAGIAAIPNNAFSGCTNLTDVVIPEGVTGIGVSAFEGCTGLTKIHIPASVTHIYDNGDVSPYVDNPPFVGCSPDLKIYCTAESAPEGWRGEWKSYVDGSSVSEYELTVFYGYTRADMLLWPTVDKTAANVVLPEGIETIVDNAFYNCDTLQSITIPDTVTSIGGYAFYDCDGLTAITIPETVTEIELYAFTGCDNLTITYLGTTEQWLSVMESGTVKTVCTDGTVYEWGVCGNYVTYSIIDNKLSFYGTGRMWEFDSNGFMYDWREQITEISLPSTITHIGAHAFSNLVKVKEVTIPEGVTSIGDYAFFGCSSLTSVTIPEGVTSIGNYAFSGCSSLTSVTIPEGVTSIGDWAFSGCSSLTSVTIPEGVTSIGVYAFYMCSSLTSVTIPEGVTSIGDYAFNECSSLTSVTIPEGVTTIGESAFACCNNLTSVTIPQSVTSIGVYAFYQCYNLTSVNIPEGVTIISDNAFSYCSSLTSVTIPEGVTSIGNYAFSGCSSLTSVTIPEGVTSIGDWAFSGCSSLTDVTIPESVTTIGREAFYECGNLTNVTIPEGVTRIEDYAFYGCRALTDITIPKGITSISNFAFGVCTGLTSVTIPEGVTTIGESAFACCNNLTSVTIPQSVTSIGIAAFHQCNNLTSVNIPEGVTIISDNAFSYCSSLTSVTIPEGVTSIDQYAFSYCSSLTSVTIPESVTSIDQTAFSGCNMLSVTYSGTIEQWKTVMGETVMKAVCSDGTIEGWGDCGDALTYDIIDKELIISGTGAIWDYNSRSPWGGAAIVKATLPDTLTAIGQYAFSYCGSLTKITIPESVTSIGSYAFMGCSKLRQIVFEGSAPAMGDSIFFGNRSVVYYPKDDASWTEEVMQDYSENTTWKPHCGDSHNFVTAPEVPPTCLEPGLTEGTYCSDCGIAQTGCEEIPTPGHKYTAVVVPPTCIEGGYTTYTCACGDSFTEAYTSATGEHIEGILPAVEATCTKTGLTEGKHCSVCSEVLTAQTVIPALGHSEVIDAGVEATCTEPGLTQGKHCSVCNEILIAQTVVEAKGHSVGESEITTPPTCTESGIKTGKCTACGETGTEPVPALGHTEVVDQAVEATCTEPGLTEGKHCSVCNDILTAQEEIPALGHTEVIDQAAEPTCTEAGLTEGKHCGVCNAILITQKEVSALGHDFSQTEITTAPTCTAEGIKAGTCARCGESIKEPVPPLGHTEVVDPEVAPTCARSGLTEGKHCDACGEVLAAQELIPAEGHWFEEGFCLTCGAPDQGDYVSFGGKSLTLKYTDPETGKILTAKQIQWSLPEEYAPYATLTAAGKLTARKVVEKVRVEAIGTIAGSEKAQVIVTADIFPTVTQVEILEEETVVNGQTRTMDFDEESRTFTVQAYPLDTVQDVTWSIGDTKKAYADYTINGNSLTVTNPTGKAGTVTIKATVNSGLKKTVSFQLNFGNFAEKVEITNTEETITAGAQLQLEAVVTPENVTKTGVTWSLKNAADKAYATISTKGVLKAKTVYGEREITIVATTKDGKVSAEYTISILPRDAGILILTMDGENVTKSTVNVDLNTESVLVLDAENLADAAAVDAAWKSSNQKIASVEDGVVTIHTKGSAVITATAADGRKATVTLKVAALTSTVTIEEPEDGLEVASGKALTLKAVCEDGASSKVTWSIVEGTRYAKIASNGKLTANKDITSAKEVLVRATAADGSGIYGEATVTIRPIAQGVQIYSQQGGRTLFSIRTDDSLWVRSNTTLEWDMNESDTLQLSSRVYPSYEEDGLRNAIQGVTWKSSSSKIAAVDEDGLVTCRKPGTVTITATAKDGSGQKVTFKLKVVKKIESLSMEDQEVVGGKSLNLAKLITINPTDATDKTFLWEITGGDGAAYASVSTTGVLKTKKVKTPVEAELRVTAKDGSGKSEAFTVTINPA